MLETEERKCIVAELGDTPWGWMDPCPAPAELWGWSWVPGSLRGSALSRGSRGFALRAAAGASDSGPRALPAVDDSGWLQVLGEMLAVRSGTTAVEDEADACCKPSSPGPSILPRPRGLPCPAQPS